LSISTILPCRISAILIWLHRALRFRSVITDPILILIYISCILTLSSHKRVCFWLRCRNHHTSHQPYCKSNHCHYRYRFLHASSPFLVLSIYNTITIAKTIHPLTFFFIAFSLLVFRYLLMISEKKENKRYPTFPYRKGDTSMPCHMFEKSPDSLTRSLRNLRLLW
jgi:hypothetical protein